MPRDEHRDPAARSPLREPVDPDIVVPPGPPGRVPRQIEILAAIAAGGVLGACARYGAVVLFPTAPAAFPWTTFWINITGCAVMGALLVLITERRTAHPLVRPFLGTGVLGGYTTFSTYTLDGQHLIGGGRAGTALFYLGGTLVAALAAGWGAATLTRLFLATRPTRDGAAG